MQPLVLTRRRIDAETVGHLIKDCLRGILERTTPRLVILFGSAARGEMTDQSDLDFLLVFDAPVDCRVASKRLRQGKLLAQVPVDLICVSSAEYARKRALGGVCMIAAEDGCILYRDPDWSEA